MTERVAEKWNRETRVALARFPGRDDLAKSLPARIGYDAQTERLFISGAMSIEERDELLAASPAGPYWLALEEIHRLTNVPDYGGWASSDNLW